MTSYNKQSAKQLLNSSTRKLFKCHTVIYVSMSRDELSFLTPKSQSGNIFVSRTLNIFWKKKKKKAIIHGVEVVLKYLLTTHSG